MIDLGHSRVPYYRVGRGPDVFFVHGWPLHAATFRDIVPKLADRFTCHLIDLPGAGDSEWGPRSKISVRDHADSVRSVIQQIGLQDFAFVAHDSGAVFAQLVAAEMTGVRGLVLGNTEIAGYRSWQVQLYVAMERAGLGALMFGALLKLRPLRHSRIAFGGCFGDPQYAEGEFRKVFLERMSKRAIQGHARLMQQFDWSVIDHLRDTQARIAAPVKLIWGADDPFFPVSKLKPTLSHYAGEVSLALIEKGKLFAHDEHPEKFVAEARPFLEHCFGNALVGGWQAITKPA
jgi:pimeloyl-ACP methyl ester carboxylesterase